MGHRLHLHTKHEIEYSNDSFFNYQQEEFFRLMSALGVEVHDGNSDYYGDEIEISREDIICAKANLSLLTSNIDSEELSFDKDDAIEWIKKLYNRDDLEKNVAVFYSTLSFFLENAPKGSEYIHFSWF